MIGDCGHECVRTDATLGMEHEARLAIRALSLSLFSFLLIDMLCLFD